MVGRHETCLQNGAKRKCGAIAFINRGSELYEKVM